MSKLYWGVAAAALLSFSNTSFADEKESESPSVQDKVVVTGTYLSNEKFSGTKTLTPIIDVPQSLSVIGADAIFEHGFTNMGDITRYAPGVTAGQGEGHRDQISIRGQNTTADFFLDGLRDDVQYFRPLYNIEQVEILRGSNAMIFGRGGGGGVVNRATKKPDLEKSFNSITAGVDTFGEYSVALDSNLPTSENDGFRINALVESFQNHRDVFEGDRYAINPTYLNELSDKTSLLLSYEYVNDDRGVDRGIPSEDLDGDGVFSPVTGFRDAFFGSEDQNFTTLEAHIVRARVDHQFNENLVWNTTAQFARYDKLYQNLYSSDINTTATDIVGGLDANTVQLDGYKDATDRRNFIMQSNLVSNFNTGPLGHTFLVGAEIADQQTSNARFDNVFASTGTDKAAFDLSFPLQISEFSFSKPVRTRDSEVQVTSGYVQDQIDIGDHFKVIAGLRFDQFDITANDLFSGDVFTRTDEEVSPRAGLIYKPAENISAYVSYSKSFLPRSGDQFLTLSDSTSKLDPEEFINQEIGLKWDITPVLSLTTAYFQLDRDTTEIADNGEDQRIVTTETKGFEVQLGGQITDQWNLNVGYSNLDSTVPNGNRAGQVPENTFSLWNRYDVTQALGFGLGVVYQDEQFVNSDNKVLIPDYTRVDAAVFYKLQNGVQLQMNVENLLDEDYFPDAHSNTNISTGAPLNARFTVKAPF